MKREMLSLAVLGPTEASLGGAPLPLRPRERDVLTALGLAPNSAMGTDDLADALWAGCPPPSALVTIQNHVSRIRRTIGAGAVVTQGREYRLGDEWDLDVDRRDTLAAKAASWRRMGRADLAVEALDAAITCTRGTAFADLGESSLVTMARLRHGAVAATLEDDLLLTLLLAGETSRAAIEAEMLALADPFREVRWAALSVALYRDGRRREAVRALLRGREALRERVGLDAGPMLQHLESLVFDDDASLLEASPAELLGRCDPGEVPTVEATVDRTPDGGATNVGELVASARSALDGLRFADAAELWRLAAEVSAHEVGPEAGATLELRLDQVDALILAGDPRCEEEVLKVVEVAEGVGGDVFARAAGALCHIGPFTAPPSRNEEVAATIERAIKGAQSLQATSAAHSEAGLFYCLTGDLDLAEEHYERSLAVARQTGAPRVILDALSATYAIVTHPRDHGRRAALAAEILALAEQTDDDDGRFTALHLYFALQVVGADPLVRTTFLRQEALARSLRAAARRWMVSYQRACVAYLDGRLDLALEIAEDAYATAPVAPARAMAAYGMQVLLVRVAQGRGQELADLVDLAIREHPDLPGWRAVAARLASLRGDRGRVEEELQALDCGRSLPVDMSWGGAVMILGRAAAAVGATESLEPLADLIRPYSGQFTWYGAGTVGPYDLALAEIAIALDEIDVAAHHLVKAQSAVTAIGAKVFQPDLDLVAHALDTSSENFSGTSREVRCSTDVRRQRDR